MLAFTLSMPGVGSWNGRWSGEERSHVIVRSFPNSAASRERQAKVLAGSPYFYSFGDGWAASVTVTEVATPEANRLRRRSAGFCGYEWMIDEILAHGRIKPLAERVTA